MMGSHDVLRLVKGLRLEEGLEGNLREGLAQRAVELRADLETIRGVRDLLSAMADGECRVDLEGLNKVIEQWDEFCALLEGPWPADAETLQEMLRFAGIRSQAMRALSPFPGAQAALTTLARPGSSFVFRGRRLAPPRCLFHSASRGCLAGRWKPGKCANFFCSGDPNVLAELRGTMSFDDFVLGNAVAASPEQIGRFVAAELHMGPQYVEPKVIVGLDGSAHTALLERLAAHYDELLHPPAAERFMMSSHELEALVEDLEPGQAAVVDCGAVDGDALYEAAIALDRFRARAQSVAFYLLARRYASPSVLPHPLWADCEMGQPLGAIDIYISDAEQA